MSSSKLSLRALSLVVVSTLATAVAGCWVEPEQPYVSPTPTPTATVPAPTPEPVRPAEVPIATHETLVSDGGKGIGVYVEYLGEGLWHLWTTCDTIYSNVSCSFALTGTPETGTVVGDVQRADASNAGDSLGTLSRDSFDVRLTTANEIDGVTVRLGTPGAALTLAASLDGVSDPAMIFWVGPDGLHDRGAPTNPVTFVPTPE